MYTTLLSHINQCNIIVQLHYVLFNERNFNDDDITNLYQLLSVPDKISSNAAELAKSPPLYSASEF